MSTRSLNKVMLIGNMTRDVDLRYTPSGTAIATFGLATNRGWTTDSGERNEDVQFHRVVAWSKLAEICGQLLFKGRKIYIEGRLQTRKWTGQDGQQRETTEIVAENMMILDNKHRDGSVPGSDPISTPSATTYTANPNAQPKTPPPAPIADDGVVIADDPTSPEATKGQAKAEDKKAVKPKVEKPVKKVPKTEKEQLDEVNVEDIPF